MHVNGTAFALAWLAASAPAPSAQETAASHPFEPSTALAEGVSPDALARLDALVQGFVDDDEVVGAELLVLKNGRSILHAAYGFADRDARVPMATGSVFCVRSMTKPLIGAATWMLIEERRLKLGDRASQFLPAFDVEGLRDITMEQLLRHQSGLPMSLIMGSDPRKLASLRAVADLARADVLEFEPGTGFTYSDQGTDTLTAVIEVVTGTPAGDFVRERLLEPLGMRDSACLMTEDHPLRARVCSNYAGSPGAWTRYWSAEDAPLFAVFLGSQAMYSTCADYARFLDLYLQGGRVGGERLLRTTSVRHTLEPGPWPVAAGSGFPGLRVDYGTLMQLWTEEGDDGGREVVAFGHSGSDGTHAWAFPEQEALVLYFTQSRGTSTGVRVEERLAELLLGAPFDPLQAAPPLEEYLGYYWEGEGDLYRAVVRDGRDLAWEILGKAVVPLDYIGDDRWKLRPQPGTVIDFDRDDANRVVGYHVGEHREFRFTPSFFRSLTAQPRPASKGVSFGVMSLPHVRYPFSSRSDSSAR
jgi:CubicO group peptidase (beta-lactamase class C family)